MDAPTTVRRRNRILEPKEVEIGYQFVLCLVGFRLLQREAYASLTLEQRREQFDKDKDKIAQQLGYDSYVSLPKDAKAFEGRCAAIKKKNSGAFFRLAEDEKAYNQWLSDELYGSIMEEIVFHAPCITFAEKVHTLFRRMSFYSCRLPALDPLAVSESA